MSFDDFVAGLGPYWSFDRILARVAMDQARPKLESDELGEGANEVVDPNDPDAGRVWTDKGGVDG